MELKRGAGPERRRMGDYVLPWWFWGVEVMGIVGVLGFGWEGCCG